MSNKRKVFFLLLVILATSLSFSLSSAADKLNIPAVGAAPDDVPEMYVPTDAEMAYSQVQAGDIARADIQAVGTGAQYVALILNGVVPNANAIAPHLFLKVGQADASGNFHYGACYLGNNGSSGHFGPMQSQGRFNLSQPFNSARMVVARLGGGFVRIKFTNVDNGTKPDQGYTCSGAPDPDPAGTKIGVASSGSAARIDNFGDDVAVRDTFTYNGALGSTGNWVDIDPGMVANGSSATGGNGAQSLWSCPPRHIDLRLDAQGRVQIQYSAGNVAQKIMLYLMRDNDTVVTQGPFNRPAGGCELATTGIQLTNPPYLLVLGVMGDQQDGGNAIVDVQVALPAPVLPLPNTNE